MILSEQRDKGATVALNGDCHQVLSWAVLESGRAKDKGCLSSITFLDAMVVEFGFSLQAVYKRDGWSGWVLCCVVRYRLWAHQEESGRPARKG